MNVLLASFVLVFGLTMLARPTMGAGWFWDAGNGFGFASFAGLLCLMVTSSRRLDVRAHQLLGYVVLLLAALHAFWFLLGDAAFAEFLKPGAPDYMWLGVAGMLLLAVLVASALLPDRLQMYRDYGAFKHWHEVQAVACIAAVSYHVMRSGFYLGSWYQVLLFGSLVAVAIFGRWLVPRLGQLSIARPMAFLYVSLAFTAAFAAIRNLPE